MRTICNNCSNNNFGNCYEDKPQYMKVYDENDCDGYFGDEDCGALDEDLGIGQDEP